MLGALTSLTSLRLDNNALSGETLGAQAPLLRTRQGFVAYATIADLTLAVTRTEARVRLHQRRCLLSLVCPRTLWRRNEKPRNKHVAGGHSYPGPVGRKRSCHRRKRDTHLDTKQFPNLMVSAILALRGGKCRKATYLMIPSNNR